MCMTVFTRIKYKVDGRIAKITMNVPEKLNAMDEQMASELTKAMLDANDDPVVKVILLTGAGKQAFCAGGDVSIFPKMDLQEGVQHIKDAQSLVHAMKNNRKPIVAAVNGYAVGAGLSLVLLSDIVISSSKAKYGAAFVNIGLIPDMGSLYFLPRAVGLTKAKELAFTGKNITADEVLSMGVVNEVVPPEKLEERTEEWCRILSEQPGLSMQYSKSLLNRSMDMGIDDLLEAESFAQGICINSEDGREGVDAFLNKRKAKFN